MLIIDIKKIYVKWYIIEMMKIRIVYSILILKE